jgi:hypothetical protein
LAARIGTLLKLGVMVAIVAASGAGYYYAVYLPRRDAARADAQKLEDARSAAAKRAEQERLLVQQQELEKRRVQAQAQALLAAQARYQSCLKDADTAHAVSQAAQCKATADKASADRDNCLNALKLPKAYCESAYVTRDGSANCTLPPAAASALDADLERARNRCLQESKAALP